MISERNVPTQREMLLDYLETQGSITPLEALDEFGIMRLGARIHELRGEGLPILTEMVTKTNRYGVKVSYARYYLDRQEAGA